jgi:hypothetical protein
LLAKADRPPANNRRHGAGGTAYHDILRRAPLEPDRVDGNIETIGKRQQDGCGSIDHETHCYYGNKTNGDAERERLFGYSASGRNWPVADALH